MLQTTRHNHKYSIIKTSKDSLWDSPFYLLKSHKSNTDYSTKKACTLGVNLHFSSKYILFIFISPIRKDSRRSLFWLQASQDSVTRSLSLSYHKIHLCQYPFILPTISFYNVFIIPFTSSVVIGIYTYLNAYQRVGGDS